MALITSSGVVCHCRRVHITHGSTGSPQAIMTCLKMTLSMPTADPTTPAPTYGNPASSSKP